MRRILGIGLLSLLAGAPLAGAAAPAITVELNKLEPRGGTCQPYLVLENRTEIAFESLKLDLVMFDPEGIVASRLAVETAPLPAGKTSLKVFEIAGMACDAIARILLNGLTSCRDGGGERDDCLALITTSARGKVGFIK
jgi:hypothetical protein